MKRSYEVQDKYHWNQERWQWERVDRVQEYRGVEIATISTHDDYHKSYHRAYKVRYPSGLETYWQINKRGSNIKKLKGWIDFKISRDDPDMFSPV